MKVNAMMVALTAILTSLAMVGCTQPIWLTIIIAIPAVIVSMKIAIAIQTASEQETTTKEKRNAVSIYWYRRIVAIIVIILAIIGLIKLCSMMGEYISPHFKCEHSVEVTVQNGDTASEMAEAQIVSGNCTGYEDLTHYIVQQIGTDLQPGQVLYIPVER